jgi:hypothetical protein
MIKNEKHAAEKKPRANAQSSGKKLCTQMVHMVERGGQTTIRGLNPSFTAY